MRLQFLSLPLCLLFYFTFTSLAANEKDTEVCFSDTSYAGEQIALLVNRHPFYEIPDTLGKMTSQDGSFHFSFPLDHIALLYFFAGENKCYFYAIPGSHYSVKVPPLEKIYQYDPLNPFFEYNTVNLYIEEETNLTSQRTLPDSATLNWKMYQAEAYYQELAGTISRRIRHRMSAAIFDSLRQHTANNHRIDSHPFVQESLTYKIAYLRSIALRHPTTTIAERYFAGSPIHFNIPAYKDLFHYTFKDFLHTLDMQSSSPITSEHIRASENFPWLYANIKDNHLHSDSLTQLVLLKNIIEEENRDIYPHSTLYAILDSLEIGYRIPPNKHMQALCQSVQKELTHLRNETPAPRLKFKTSSGETHRLEDYRGRYVYLVFCSAKNFECQRQPTILEGLYQRFEKKVSIVMILTDEWEEYLTFAKKRDYDWDIAHWDNCQTCLKAYRIKAFPTYFLIGKKGELLSSPASAPTESFESQLFKRLREAGDL